MDLDNINDIEVLRELAKESRVKMKEDVDSEYGNYIFKKDYWYIIEQDEYYVTIYSDDYNHTKMFTYKEAGKYLTGDSI